MAETPEQTKEFLEFERKLNLECSGDTDLLYRKYGYPNGKPNKKYVYVEKGVCPKHGYAEPCPVCTPEESEGLEWLRVPSV